ncbi:iron-containing alcohol dehydrogenase [Euzebyella marina]|uniref:Iron-containing alcohol dehydrogenase n=1 Tax=Euzebyella marina TaxID=1761453 RepID=A0A3G2L4K1_9FLAO|nr:iron-containing alcohol dehydrogenase family protein [Euzebyella marina]AYN67173.1 iron-containing alcohol dehydrogenase [Euzebyella marina]MAU70489.1 alcohol dehydrogenase [Pseudozobellia sp.]MBG48994.1 alcohol dehydrogenase [Pseudozobellia sp.]|tara:strand:- start:33302 stop:34429 length:1128 start_codon:yes stop_codon:yes gene_type:complete
MEYNKHLGVPEIAVAKKTMYKNFPMVPRVIFGKGSFDQLADILLPKRRHSDAPFIFLVDDVFEGKALVSRIPLLFNDQIIFISADEEPKTQQVDMLVGKIQNDYGELPSGIVGIGGGTIMDLAKAVSILLTNKGSSSLYQGWDLVHKPSIYHVGIPTISGTGAEVSRTAVLLGPQKKLGINSDFTTFDQVVLDPDLTQGVPKEQWFYTGMDCFIHCIESLDGTYLNAFSQSYGEKALELCKEVYLGDLSAQESRDKLMMASWHGGMSIAYSQVGVAHAMSYGLGFLLGVRHGLGNCLVFQHLEEFYPEGVRLFKIMQHKHDIGMPEGVCSQLSDSDFQTMIRVSLSMKPLWENALGPKWQEIITPAKLESIYRKI